jgi:hypothetical protein
MDYTIKLTKEEQQTIIEQATTGFHDSYKRFKKQGEPSDHFTPSHPINDDYRLSCWIEEQEKHSSISPPFGFNRTLICYHAACRSTALVMAF